jgi:hypothetical protein
MLPPLAAGAQYQAFGGTPTSSLLQAVYALYTTVDTYPGDEVVGLGNIDLYYGLNETLGNFYNFGNSTASLSPALGDMLNGQFTSMYGWSSIGSSNYNALQVSLRKQFSARIQFDMNYTFSKSIDITSAAARVGCNQGLNGSQLVNGFSPNQNRGVSDFDSTHQINATGLPNCPLVRGKNLPAVPAEP